MDTNKIKTTISVSSRKKAIKDKLAALPMIIFGGSPIKVAVPPIFEARISVIKKGIGFISSSSATTNVIGNIKITVVTLSKNADANAVKTASVTKTFIG